MNWLKKNWVFITSVMVLALNVEFVVMPNLVIFTHIRGNIFFYIAAICATTELFYWYFVPLQRFKELAALRIVSTIKKPSIGNVIFEFHAKGFIAAILLIAQCIKEVAIDIAGFIANNVLKKTEVNNFLDSKRFRLIIFVMKWGGYFFGYSLMFLLGLGPFGLWVVGLAFCRSRRWFIGILFVAMGNILKTYLWSLAFMHYYP